MKRHAHKVKSTRTAPFTGPVATSAGGYYRVNPAAHGGHAYIDTCRCGAVRYTNVNGLNLERGPWRAS